MSNRKITITYNQQRFPAAPAPPPYVYLLRVTVEQPYTEPAAFKTCLVVRKGSDYLDEIPVRVGSYAEVMRNTSPVLVDLPPLVTRFSSTSMPTGNYLSAGNKIKILNIPEAWQMFFGAPLEQTYTIASNVKDTEPLQEAIVTTPFPAFGRNLRYEILDNADVRVYPPSGTSLPTDGVANRDYTGLLGSEFLCSDVAATFRTDLQAVRTFRALAEADARLLISTEDSDTYTTVNLEVYE